MTTRNAPRIGLVIGQLTFGGAESQLYELALALRTDHRVTVYCLSDRKEPYGRRLEHAGIPVQYFESRGSFDIRRAVRLGEALRRDEVEVVHAFLFIASAYAYLATRRMRCCALVTSARNCKPESNLVRRVLMRRAFRASDAVLCNSHMMRDYAVEYYGAPKARTHVVYNGVDARRFADRRKLRPIFTAGTIGRLEAQKNLSLFIDAATRVARIHPGACFAVIGQGSLRTRLQEDVVRRGLAEVVRFLGTTDDIAGFLADTRQFWLTSDWEGTPNVVLEAMAAGVPVVATEAGAVSELIRDGDTGYVVSPGDVEAFAEKSLRLLSDSDLSRRLSERAQRRVYEEFSIERMVEETLRVYDLAVEGRR